jgi:hypothetical protein
MKMKQSSRVIGIAVLIAVGTLSQLAEAIPSVISQNDNITISSGSLVTASSGLSNYGDPAVFPWLKNDVLLYNAPIAGAHLTTPLPTPTDNSGVPFQKVSSGFQPGGASGSVDITLGGYDYLFLHWGGQGGGWGQAYYVGGLTGTFEFDAPPGGNPAVGGLSFYSFYGPTTGVPDGGTTVFLLGAAVSGLGMLRRRLN